MNDRWSRTTKLMCEILERYDDGDVVVVKVGELKRGFDAFGLLSTLATTPVEELFGVGKDEKLTLVSPPPKGRLKRTYGVEWEEITPL